MPTPDQIRLTEARARPRIMDLWWALRPLTSVVRFMQSGAHPDDEISAMLAALTFRDGINISYACSTRGEGGQNDIGTEAGAELGALRTREMERACDVLGMRMYWHGEAPDDPITDFGFSKSGDETLDRWGHDRTLARFVEIVRTDRPDILCPTFLDVPGQHGHHRAMTRAAHEVMAAAADPAFASNLPPWQVKKLYLPAWSGAGQAYDDDLPPPPATLIVDGSGRDPVSGWTWERIGQMSRAFHRTQGMGRWPAPGAARDFPLHLVLSHAEGPDSALWSGLPRTVADLADGAGPAAAALTEAGAAIDEAIASFPGFPHVARALTRALAALRQARASCPEAQQDNILHRLDAKEAQIGQALRSALGAEARLRLTRPVLRQGDSTAITLEADPGEADGLDTALDLPAGWTADRTADRTAEGGTLTLAGDAATTDPYRAAHDPAEPPAPALVLHLSSGGQTARIRLPFETEPVALPDRSARVTPAAAILNRATGLGPVAVALSDIHPGGAEVRLDLPEGWHAAPGDTGPTVTPPDTAAEGLYRLPVRVGGAPAVTIRRIAHPHVAPTATTSPAELRLRVIDARLPGGKIGYVGAGNDRVGHWLAAMGADVTELTDAALTSDTALAAFDAIVVGIFAMRFRPGLLRAIPALHRWTENGGTLVTLYHRPWDNWDPDTVPPRRLEIGQPSLRWRVTDETAPVTHLTDHPLLTTPNRIGPQDWAGWVKERGLYFAKSWDPAYTPLIELADPGEAPHRGALLVADIGKGRHVHTALILHHQMENLVPGAFRLMANLIAKRG